jgi:hypothetical protein
MKSMEQKEKVTFEQLIEAARKENWEFVDENINESHLTRVQVDWALDMGLGDEDKNIRDLAATLLDKSNEALNPEEMEKLEKIMTEDSYHIVQYRIAIALYKRGNRNPLVVQMMKDAREDPDVGELACSYFE